MDNESKKKVDNDHIKRIILWEDGCKPKEKGWHAVNYCWDTMEGSFCDACYFNGESWAESLPINKFAGAFENKSSAMEWVAHNDIGF